MGRGMISHYVGFWEDDVEDTICPQCNGTGRDYIPATNKEALMSSNEKLAKKLIKTIDNSLLISYVCSDGKEYTYNRLNDATVQTEHLKIRQKYNLALRHEIEWLQSPSE